MLASSHGVIDLSFAPGKDHDLSDLPFGKAMMQEVAPEEVRELNITHAHVLSLTSTPGAIINHVLQHVTMLRAAHNEVSHLNGIEAFGALEVLDLSHNRLRVVDAHAASLLKTLKQLRSIDFSYNNMSLLDLNGSVGAPSSRLTGLGAGATPSFSTNASVSVRGSGGRLSLSIADPSDALLSLTALNLSHNAFIDLPDLRSAPYLQVLNMSHNKLDALVDFDTRLPLLSLHSLALHSNLLPTATALLPLCGVAATLKHVQVFRNPFTLVKSGPKAAASYTISGERANLPVCALDESMWWRPFLLWLCPLLVTVDQAEFTASERRVAGIMLFRENGLLSKSRMEYMNPQRKDELEAYLRRKSESATPPRDAMTIIDNIEQQEENMRDYSGATWGAGSDGAGQVMAPMSRMGSSRIPLAAPARRPPNGILSASPSMPPDPLPLEVGGPAMAEAPSVVQSSRRAGGAASRTSPGTRVVVVAPETQLSLNPSSSSVFITNQNRQRIQSTSMASFVRALQRKLRSLEEVVAVLWHADLSRRTKAAIVIQRFMRGALARMHLSEEEAESCHFIRYQLQQAAHGARAAAPQASVTGAGGCSSGVAATRGASQRHPSLEPVEDTGSNMQEVLISMRSLQEVMSSMWIDLGEYRAMADREQRRAAVLIQRHYRGYRARCVYGRTLKQHRSPSPPASSCIAVCQCAAETAALRQEVGELRREVGELRELLQHTTRQERLATYIDPERAMDAIIRKHEQRSNDDLFAKPAYCQHLHEDSRPPNATPSFIERAVGDSASLEKAVDDIAPDQGPLMEDNGYGDGAARAPEAGDTQLVGNAALPHVRPVTTPHSPEVISALDRMSPKGGSAPKHPTRITKLMPNSGSRKNTRRAGKD
ncbi:hypothetical protein GH5_04154 [Leishmania sp. Ghana 2012 LV757]|uniref:hypothetical protein n=1 Tax=Leishmania sp. Ghana 2012 LV757 TaxID=2803181 RepID=UPI001B584FC3|nr:hypothetical protein GH5_04154 [Leishmania sp. Ghana 2012 LV757]